MGTLKALHSSERMDWQTPDEVLDLVRSVGPIGYDPCTTPDNPTGARWVSAPPLDGLTSRWGLWELIYVNPPYGRELPKWTAKCAREGTAGSEIILLVPARTDTVWFHRDIRQAHRVCFWKGRMRFKGAASSAPFPSLLAYWGQRPERFTEVFASRGVVVDVR